MLELEYFGRVVIAGICGMVIGYERKNRAKEAGLRTHCIVACAAALMMIISKYGFFDLVDNPLGTRGADPARIAAQVVSGVGFLGAGMIFVQRQTIKGLTTAAGIWATAGIGMAIGAGMYIIGILVAFFVILVQIILHKNMKFLMPPHSKHIMIKNVDRKGYQTELAAKLKELNLSMEDIDVSYDSGKKLYNYSFIVELPPDMNEEMILDIVEYDTMIESIR